MKQALRHLAATLCMLMLIASAASCMDMANHRQALCGHCAQHQPINQQTPVCCDAHHQPSATATAIAIEQPARISAAETSAIHGSPLPLLSLPDQLIWPPPLPPRHTLRI